MYNYDKDYYSPVIKYVAHVYCLPKNSPIKQLN